MTYLNNEPLICEESSEGDRTLQLELFPLDHAWQSIPSVLPVLAWNNLDIHHPLEFQLVPNQT